VAREPLPSSSSAVTGSLAPPAPDSLPFALPPGSLVGNRFEIERLAGSGGMGAVYRALDQTTGEVVALKVLHMTGTQNTTRFEREARILADLRHPAVARYVAHGTTETLQPFLAMEWLEGEDLADRLGREGLTLDESIRLISAAADALRVAHRRGIVHRDIKPSNLFLIDRRLDRVKLLDFGIARMMNPDAAVTRTGATLGTPAYMAPEQARGAPDVDARADVFALGCVLFECIARRPPFTGEHTVAVLAKILFEDPPRLSDLCPEIPAALDDLMAEMLSKDPLERPRDAGALLIDLQHLTSAKGPRPRIASVRPTELGAGEQRLLSVVFVAATSPWKERDNSDALREEVERYGGQLEQLADGSFIATLSGVGTATDQAVRAARCALSMRTIASSITIAKSAPMALATGRGIVGGKWPVGEVIDRMVRWLGTAHAPADDAAGPRPIHIDEVTAGLLDARFEVGGDERGLDLFCENDGAELPRTLLGKPTSCVGREREIFTLETIFAGCVEQQAAQVVLVTAPVGMGKSRVRHEFLRRLEERDAPVEVWVGRGDPMSAGSPFGLLASALRRAAGMRDGEPLAVQQQKLRARVARHVPAAEAPRVAEFLGELLSVPSPGDPSVQLRAAQQEPILMGDQMRRAWEDFLAAECGAQPVVLVLEDLQWGDLPTVKAVDGALRHLPDQPLLILALARPEVHELFPGLWADRGVTEVQLGELSRKAAERLVREALGAGVDPDVVASIVERAAGNALYLEELIRAVAEGRGDALPETVLAMLQSRLERLDPEARRILRAASVFGRVFWSGSVVSLLGGSARTTEILEWLPELVQREILQRHSTSKFPGEDEYVFRHDLMRATAYEMLTSTDRALGHQLAGEWLEHAGERDALVLAEHFDRGGAPSRAITWYERGAEQALEAHDFAAAVARAARGIACGADGPTLGALRLIQAEVHRWRGELGDAERCAVLAAELLPRGAALWFRAMDEAISASGRRGSFGHAEAVAAGLTAAIQPGADSARVICLCGAARHLLHAGRYEFADRILAEIAGKAADLGPRALAEVHRLRGAKARHLGDIASDVAGYEAALAAYEEAGDARHACNCRVSLGFGYIELGAFEAARVELERALAAAERMGIYAVLRRARQNMSLVLAANGEFTAAAAMATHAIEASHAQGDFRFEAWTRLYLSRIRRCQGDLAAAEGEARLAAELLSAMPPARAGALATLALALLDQQRVAEALSSAREALGVLEALGGIEEFEPVIRLAFAEAARAAGAYQAAHAAIVAARARILRQAEGIHEPSLRHSFLTRVADNASILELAQLWAGGPDPPAGPAGTSRA
jgi:serine/threonine protein kinase/tetratricopeptide (TPR) repeat protein